MEIIRIKTKQKDFFYYIFLALLLFLYMIEATAVANFNDSLLHDVVQVAALIAALFCLVLRKDSFKNLMKIFLFNLVGILCFISSGNTGLFMTMLAVTLFPDTNIDNVLKFVFKEEVFLFCVVIILSMIGIIPNCSIEVAKGTYSVIGMGLGFSHPNMLAAQASSIILLYLCTRKSLYNHHLCIAVGMIGVIFIISQSRTALILMLFACFVLSLRKNKRWQKFVYNILPYTYIIIIISIALFLFLFAKFGASNRWVHLINDSLFNGRIGLAYTSLITYPSSLFGKSIDMSIWNEWQYFALDNGQIMIWLQYGIMGFVSYFFVIQKVLMYIKRRKKFTFAVAAIVLLGWSMYEGTMYFLGKNFIYLLGAISLKNSIFEKRRVDKV